MGSDIIVGGTVSQRIRSCLMVLGKFLQQRHPVVSSFVPYESRNDSKKVAKDDLLAIVANIFGNNFHIFVILILFCKIHSVNHNFHFIIFYMYMKK